MSGAYATDSDLVGQIDYKTDESTTLAGSVRQYEPDRDLIDHVENQWLSGGTISVSKYDYANDDLGRRQWVVRSGTAFAQGHYDDWAYNDRNELTGSERYNNTDPPSQANPDDELDFGYAYDPIGNRETMRAGDPNSPLTTYTANNLNQYDPNDPNDGYWEPTPTLDRKFVWYNWLPLEELDALNGNAIVRTYTWGLDLSGQNSEQNRDREGAAGLESAGGIGGLLALHDPDDDGDPNDPNDVERNYAYFYDANGNVGQLVAWASDYGGASGYDWHADRLVACYEYDPYGSVIGPDTDDDGEWQDDAGPYAADNPIRFSTKYFDAETALGYWGYRYYSPRLGRWMNRDPIGETGGQNIYAYVGNSPADRIDRLGRDWEPTPGHLKFYSWLLSRSGCCGPSIGLRLGQLLNAVEGQFGDLLPSEKAEACINMISSGGWEIAQFHRLGTPGGSNTEFYKGGCNTGDCKGTLQLFGRCYRANEMNYVLWGKMNKLCRDSLPQWATLNTGSTYTIDRAGHTFTERYWVIDCDDVTITSEFYHADSRLPENIFSLAFAKLGVTLHRVLGGRNIPAGPAGPGGIGCRQAFTEYGYTGNYGAVKRCALKHCGLKCCRRSYMGRLGAHAGGHIRVAVP